MRTLLLASALLASAAACGDDEVSYSDPVGISLSVASGDVQGGLIEEDKNVNTESGNPYGAFVAAARDELGGDPGAIRVDDVSLALEVLTSDNVAALGLVFAGEIAVAFELNSGPIYPIASAEVAADTDAGPIGFDVAFDSDELPDAEYAELVGGNFKVVLSGAAAAGFDALDASADLELTLLFTALE